MLGFLYERSTVAMVVAAIAAEVIAFFVLRPIAARESPR